MRGFISEIWGWDEQWQRTDFATYYDPQGITLAFQEHELAGYSHIENQDGQIFIRMIVVHPHHQRNGIQRMNRRAASDGGFLAVACMRI